MDTNYFLMNPVQRFLYKSKKAILGFPKAFGRLVKKLVLGIGGFFRRLGAGFANYLKGFARGDALTKVSYALMGTGHMFRGQFVKGLIYLLCEIGFVLYMVLFGGTYLGKFFDGFFTGGTVGTVETADYWNDDLGVYEKIVGDNSFKIILYGILTIFMVFFFLAIYL